MADKPGWYYGTYVSLQNTIDRWQKQGEKLYDAAQPVMVPVKELWPYREYPWKRGRARRDMAEWDELAKKMAGGWDPDEPLHFVIGSDGGAKVGEGNHRLAIVPFSSSVPVRFHFQTGKVAKYLLGADFYSRPERNPRKRRQRKRVRRNSAVGWIVSGLVLGGVVIGGYFAWRWVQNRIVALRTIAAAPPHGAITGGVRMRSEVNSPP